MQMNRQLGLRVAQRRQGGHRGQLPTLQIQSRSAVNIAEWKLNRVTRQIRRHIGQRRQHLLAGFPIDLRQLLQTRLITFVAHLISPDWSSTPETIRVRVNSRSRVV